MLSFTLYVEYLEKHVLSSVIKVSLSCKGVRGRKTWWDWLYQFFQFADCLAESVPRNHSLIATHPNVFPLCSVTWTESTNHFCYIEFCSSTWNRKLYWPEEESPWFRRCADSLIFPQSRKFSNVQPSSETKQTSPYRLSLLRLWTFFLKHSCPLLSWITLCFRLLPNSCMLLNEKQETPSKLLELRDQLIIVTSFQSGCRLYTRDLHQ